MNKRKVIYIGLCVFIHITYMRYKEEIESFIVTFELKIYGFLAAVLL